MDILTGIHSAMVERLIVVNRSCISEGVLYVSVGKNAEDSNLASVEARQWILLYLL
jgi:hypothetical protein